jgi:hypothetical protein
MTDWEDILNAYLEGRGLRADAEDLLMRLHLTSADRDLIERSLRLADQVTTALRQAPQPVAGSADRLIHVLRSCPAPATMPEEWRSSAEGFAAAATMTIVKDAPVADEDLLDAALEGRVSLNELRAMREANQVSDSVREALEELEMFEAGVVAGGGPVPDGMEDRLRSKLRSFMESEEGDVDAKVAERLLGGRCARKREMTFPDVLAAEEEPEGDGE